METLTVDVDDRLAVVTITRPEVRNALSRQVLADLRDALAELRDRDDVGLVAVCRYCPARAAPSGWRGSSAPAGRSR